MGSGITMARKRKTPKEIEIDLHGMTKAEADLYITETLNILPDDVEIVRVVHGYHGGHVLYQLVRNEYLHYKIDYKLSPFANNGETLFYIKRNS